MTDWENPCIETDYEEIFYKWYETEGVRKIQELSRQLRTFFKYRTEVIRYRFQTTTDFAENYKNTNFLNRKKDIESQTKELVILLKNLKKSDHTLEGAIRSLTFYNDNTRYKNLLDTTEKLSILLHYFSEKSLHNHPEFLKFIVKLAEKICMVKKCLFTHFTEFYTELELNYFCLRSELEDLLSDSPKMKNKKSIRQLEETLIS